MAQAIYLLDNPVQPYAWGSKTAIPELLGTDNPDDTPQAELWLGAHPKAPSRLVQNNERVSLAEVIKQDPIALLGNRTAQRFDGELPFLMKVLAAAEPLSIQAHPNQEQARAGFDRENAQGIPLTDFARNYRDPSHKPELLSAMTRFWALKGFRPIDRILSAFEPIHSLAPELQQLQRTPTKEGLRDFFSSLMTLPADRRETAIKEALQHENAEERDWVAELHKRYPGDIGVLSPLILNVVCLEPEEALYLEAGELHAYLEGVGIEIMANSDNVLRGGLTPKHVDVTELLKTLTFEPGLPEILKPQLSQDGIRRYETGAHEFALAIIDVAEDQPFECEATQSIEILLLSEGSITITDGTYGEMVSLERGGSVLIPAAVPDYLVVGEGRIYRAFVP